MWVTSIYFGVKEVKDALRRPVDSSWFEKKDLNNFVDYEGKVGKVLGNYQMIVLLCIYSLDRHNAMEIIDAAINHQFVMIRKEGKWELIDSSKQLTGENIWEKFTWMVNSEYGTIFRKRKHFKTNVRWLWNSCTS
jgi:hypothetical protein